MAHTITEKILAKYSAKKEVFLGEFILSKVDIVLSNDITSPITIEKFSEMCKNGIHSEEEWIDLKDLEKFYLVLKKFVKEVNTLHSD